MVTPTKIFISYARKDGKADADKLRQRLTDEGLDVWLDLVAMNIGENWQPQLFEAIEQADALVMVITPAALTSTMARQEWVHARRVGTPIFPVAFTDIYKTTDENGNPKPKEEQVPRWVSKPDTVILDPSFVGVDDKWQTLIKQLRNPPKPRRVPNMVQKLQPEYVERKALYPAIVADLLDTDGASPKKSPHHTVLLGEGGFGKTTLAEAIGLNIDITEAYTGGVFFVTIGESASQLNDKWHSMLQVLGDENRYIDPIEQLKLRLKGDDFLVILDDVWDKAHVDPILRLGNCNFLITTRDGMIANNIARNPNSIHTVKEMTSDEAREVLLKYIPINKRESALKDVQLVADIHALGVQLGEWALLLDIHGSTMRQECNLGYDVREALDYVLEGLHEEGLEPFPKGTDEDTRRRTLRGSMNASLRRYTDDEKTRIYELSIFPDDTAIPVAIVSRLWTGTSPMSNRACRDLLRRVAGHFCRFRAEHDDETPLVRFHDKVREYLAGQLPDAPTLHRQFLAKFGVSDWADLPHDEQYLWRNIAYHLIEAGQGSVLRGLLITYRWLDAKLRATDPNAMLNDCDVWLSHGKDEPIRLIRSAISMSAHVLDDKNALAHQLAGRLMHYYTKVDEIRAFLDVVMQTPNNLFITNLSSEYSIMNTAGGALIRTMKHQDLINGAYILDNGRILSWGDGAIHLWDEDGNFLKYLRVNTSWDRVLGVRGLPDGRILSWGYDDNIWLWDSEGNLLARLRDRSISEGEYSAQVGDVQLLPNGNLLSWCKNKRFLVLWDKNGKLIKTIDGYDENICGAKLLPNGNILAWSDKSAKIWDLDGNFIASPQIRPNPSGILSGVEILDDGYIVLWQELFSSRTWIWDSNYQSVAEIEMGHGEIYGVKSWSNGIFLSWSSHSYSGKNELKLWNYKGQVVRKFSEHSGTLRGAIVLPNQQILSWNDGYFGETDPHRIKLWNSDGELLKTLSGHTGQVKGVLISPNNLVLSWGDDKTLRLWDIEKEIITDRTRHNTKINHILILTNKQVISCSDDNTLRLWDFDGNLLATMEGHTASVINAIELSDGNILSWSYDNKLRLWDRTGASLAVFEGHYSEIWWARELEDGRIVSGSNDTTRRLWDKNGLLISTLDEEYYENKEALLNWASEHQFDGNVFYTKKEPAYKKYLNIYLYDDRFEIFKSEGYWNSQKIYTFYGDAPFTAFDISDDTIVVGDKVGQVLFLRWVGEDWA